MIIAVIFFLSSCEKREFENNEILTKNREFLCKIEKTFCQSDPEIEISKRRFIYDENGNKTEELLISYGEPNFKTTSAYNFRNLKITDSVYHFSYNVWMLSSSYEYKYSNNKLVEKINYDTGKTYLYI